jgi:lipoprotein-anchoring transpeptidase ErfK/SrfK
MVGEEHMRRRDLIAAAATLIAAPLIVEDAQAFDDVYGSDPLHIRIWLRKQRILVFKGDALIGVSRISTGKRGYRTPPGSYSILEKRLRHYSNLYDNAPMHYMQRLTWDGVALHAGRATGRPLSHGCIRLPRRFAQDLFAVTSVGTPVLVE